MVYCTRYPSPAPCPRQVEFQLRPDAPVFVPPKTPTSRPDAPEIAPSATRSALAAEPNEADVLPALDSGREKLLSSTESKDALKDCRWLARTLAIILRPSSNCYKGRCYHSPWRTQKATPSPVLALIIIQTSSCSYTMLRPTPSLPCQVLGTPEMTVHAAHDIVASGKLSSTTASALPKDALAVSADPKGQVSRLEATPSKSCPARWAALRCTPLLRCSKTRPS